MKVQFSNTNITTNNYPSSKNTSTNSNKSTQVNFTKNTEKIKKIAKIVLKDTVDISKMKTSEVAEIVKKQLEEEVKLAQIKKKDVKKTLNERVQQPDKTHYDLINQLDSATATEQLSTYYLKRLAIWFKSLRPKKNKN